MKFTLASSLAFLIAIAAHAQVPLETKFKNDLEKFQASYILAMRSNNTRAVEEYFSDSIRLMPEFQKTVIGKNHAALYYKAFFSRFKVVSYSRLAKEVFDVGAQIIELGSFKVGVVRLSNGVAHNWNGKYLNVWAKPTGEKLSLITEAWNYDEPLAIEHLLKFDEIPTYDAAMSGEVTIKTNVAFELAALNNLMEVTISHHDPVIWSQFYCDDAAFLYSRNHVHAGRVEINNFLKEHVVGLPVFEKLSIRNDRIDNLGNFVIEYASHIAVIRAGEFSGVFTGKDLRIWKRGNDCSLKIFRHIAMYD